MAYKIIRFCRNEKDSKHLKVIKKGLTLKKAKEYCQREDTREPGKWFDGFVKE